MRFLLVTPVFVPAYCYGGPPRLTLSLAHALQSVGHEVLVLTTTANGATELDVPVGVETTVENVPVIYSPRKLLKSYFYSPDLLATLRKVGPHFDIGLVKGVWTYVNAAASSAAGCHGQTLLCVSRRHLRFLGNELSWRPQAALLVSD